MVPHGAHVATSTHACLQATPLAASLAAPKTQKLRPQSFQAASTGLAFETSRSAKAELSWSRLTDHVCCEHVWSLRTLTEYALMRIRCASKEGN